MEIIRIENRGTVDQPWGYVHLDQGRSVEFWGSGAHLTWKPETWPRELELTDDDVDRLWRLLDATDWSKLPAGGVVHEQDAHWNSLTDAERETLTQEILTGTRVTHKE